MPTIIGALALFVLAAYIAHVTGNPENFLWTVVAVPFVLPVTAIVLWIIGKLLAAFRGPPPSPRRTGAIAMPTLAFIILAAFVSTQTGSADAFIAVLVAAPLAALGLFYVLLLAGWLLRAIRSGSKPR